MMEDRTKRKCFERFGHVLGSEKKLSEGTANNRGGPKLD